MSFPLSDGPTSIDTKGYRLKVMWFKLTSMEWLLLVLIVNVTGSRITWDVSL